MDIDNVYVGFVIGLLIAFIFVMTIAWLEDLRELDNIYKRSHIFMDNYRLQNKLSSKEYEKHMQLNMKEIIRYEGKKSLLNKMLNSCYKGLMQGGFIGMMSGGVPNALGGGLVYGMTNPILIFVQHQFMHKEELPHLLQAKVKN